MKLSTMRFLRTALTVAILGFLASAIYISVLVLQRNTALEEVGLGNVNWTIAQGPTEFLRLQQRVSAFGREEQGASADEIKLRFDIFANRLKTFRSKAVERFIEDNPSRTVILDEIEADLDKVRPLLDNLSQPGTTSQILQILESIYPKLARLSTDANVWNGMRIDQDRKSLFELQWALVWMFVGMIVCGLALIALLVLHNRLLARTQETVRAQDRELAIQNERFDAALNTMSIALCLLDADKRIVVCNAAFRAIFNLGRNADVIGRSLTEVTAYEFDGTVPHTITSLGDNASGRDAIAMLRDHIHHLPDGRVLSVSYQPMGDDGWVCTFENVTERQRAQELVVHMAHHDALTGLPNRMLLWESTTEVLREIEAGGKALAMMYLDLDRFKEVNDTLGHPVGDKLLCQVADRIRNATDAVDMVARLGGDEFAVLHRCESPLSPSTASLAARLLEAINRPYRVDQHDIIISTSIGVAIAPFDGDNTDELMKNADLALYYAKGAGGRSSIFFSHQMEADLKIRHALETDLRKGIDEGQFELHYQPMVSLKTNRIVCGEALMRWNHPTMGPISPAVFIPLAEQTGAINALGRWALQSACREAAKWPSDVSLSVNLSPTQFREPDLVDGVRAILADTHFPAKRLELEITESVLLQNNDANLGALHALRALGLSIALDDFGTGYSSLSYLQRFPFDKLKIDQSFVRDIESRPDSRAIVKLIIGLAQTLKMTTTAEGVETEAQLAAVQKAGCAQAQGYLFSRPVPAARFLTLINETNRSPASVIV